VAGRPQDYVLDGPDRNAVVVSGPDGEQFVVPLPNYHQPSPSVELAPCDARCPRCRGESRTAT
jgi:hypothetical protein